MVAVAGGSLVTRPASHTCHYEYGTVQRNAHLQGRKA